jgi:hypothetical protein
MYRKRKPCLKSPLLSQKNLYLLSLSLSGLENDSFLHVDKDIIGRVSVKGLLEQLLIEVMTDESNRSTQNEKTIKGTALQVIGCFVFGECSTSTEEITE